MADFTGGEILDYLKSMLRTLPKGLRTPMCSMREVVDHGRPYLGRCRPKGSRKRAEKRCFYNAAALALRDRGTYVEGYACRRDGLVHHHAWLTLDGVHAIDVTWDNPADCHYFGIAFPKEIVSRYGRSQDFWASLLSEDKPSAALCALLAEARSDLA